MATNIDILTDWRVPIPFCNENDTFTLPGDGSIESFARGLGQDFSHMAVDFVLQQLGLQVQLIALVILLVSLNVFSFD